EEDGDSVRHAVQKSLRGARNPASTCGKFDRQPEQQDAGEVEQGRSMRLSGTLDESEERRSDGVDQHGQSEGRREGPGDKLGRGKDCGEYGRENPNGGRPATKQSLQAFLESLRKETEDRGHQEEQKCGLSHNNRFARSSAAAARTPLL